MKPKSRARMSEADGYYLPGLFGDDDVSTPLALGDSSDAFVAKSNGYWVRRSAQQRADDFGRPEGYRYELMLAGRVVQSGTGGNFRRSFLASATFLNSKQPHPQP